MLMNGYPDPANRLLLSQLNIWNTIQANNSTDATDVATGWATDPKGLKEAMMILNPPPVTATTGHWVVYADPSRDLLLWYIMYWMNRNHYPVAALINRGGHWVALVDFISDVAPVSGSSPTLQSITKYDPEPHNVGTVSTMTGAVWKATDWNGDVMYAGTWLGKYVAVIEPPEAKGTVKIEKVTRIGTKVIPPEKAAELVRAWVKESKIPNKQQHALLSRKDIVFLPPLIATEHAVSAEKPKVEPCYYLVPVGLEEENRENEPVAARMTIIVNAFTGAFEEVTSFGKPVKYLPERDAVHIAVKALGIKRLPKNVKATLEFTASDITHIRAYPYWKVAVNNRVIYIDQLGEVYGKIKISIPGD